ncbi:NHL repeat protein [bacterium BMS3Abin03]|nr:NHL repeat protein [bacterium BMS3Abin03]
MKYLFTLILFFLLNSFCAAQQFQYERSFGNFKSATSFYITPAGIVLVTDDITDEVYQLDTLGNIINFIGGYGWEINSFDDPVDVFADALRILISDKNNHRIQRFDKNLNFIFQFYTRDSDIEEERFGYPLSAVTSNLGDVFILDSENIRILKFDLFGNFIQTIGGYDYGSYSLSNPKQLAVSMQNNLYVIDGNNIFIYDNYGTALGMIEADEELNSIRIIFNWMTVSTSDNIYITNLNSEEQTLVKIFLDDEIKPEIVSSLIFNGKLYILTQSEIRVYSPL